MPLIPMSKSPRTTDASIDVKPTCTKRGVRESPLASSDAMSTSKPRTFDGSAGSASTIGAPPSASPPQRSSAGGGSAMQRGTPARAQAKSVPASARQLRRNTPS